MDSLTSSKSGTQQQTVKTFGPLVGYCFIINYIVGTGFLGVPYVFWHTGIVAGIATMAAISWFITFPALWTLEVMARAQACSDSINNADIQDKRSPFRITTGRKFEVTELCRIFIGRLGGSVYMVIVLFYLWIGQWLTAPVAGTAWSTLLPVDNGVFRQCTHDDFKGVNHPTGGCWNLYALCVLFFGFIVVPMSCLDIKEQQVIQVFMTLMRFVLIGCIIIYSISAEIIDSEKHSHKSIPWFDFHANGFLAAIPVVVYAQMLHLSIPTLVQPVSNKRVLTRLLTAVLVTTTIIYGLLGVTVAIYQKSDINEVCTLNWQVHTKAKNIALRILSYFIVLFPSLDVCSAYSLYVSVMANLVDYLITGSPSRTPDRLTRTVHRFFWATTPLIGAVFLSDIVVLDKYSGLLAFFVAFWFPAILQYRSQVICDHLFGHSATPYSSWWSSQLFIYSVFVVGVAITIATFVGFVLPDSLS